MSDPRKMTPAQARGALERLRSAYLSQQAELDATEADRDAQRARADAAEAEVARLRAELAAAEAEAEELAADVQRRHDLTRFLAEAVRDGHPDAATIAADYLDGTVLDSHQMTLRGGALIAGGWATRLIGKALFENLDASGAVNNCEWTITGAGREAVLSAQWKHGLTPSQQRAAAIAERDAARAEAAGLRAIVEGRTVAPSDAEIESHAAAGGRWIFRWSDGSFGTARGRIAVAEAREPGVLTAVRWWPLDATGRPCAWPVAP